MENSLADGDYRWQEGAFSSSHSLVPMIRLGWTRVVKALPFSKLKAEAFSDGVFLVVNGRDSRQTHPFFVSPLLSWLIY